MKWRPSDELERLLNDLADELLRADDEERLAEILRGDSAARAHYRKWMALHSALAWDYASGAPEQVGTDGGLHRARRWRNGFAIAAVLAGMIAVAALIFRNDSIRSGSIIEVEDVVGSLSWTGSNGEAQSVVAKGKRLGAGNLQLGDETSTAVLRFNDGSRLTLGGGGDVMVADGGQKRVHLKAGTLSADVRTQPKGRPLLIHTPTATLEVVGTVFTVTAAPEQTTMSVHEGRVRFERLADGEKVEVSANHAVTASFESSSPLVAKPSTMPSASWKADFSQPPEAGSRGDWIPASASDPARMKAVPLVVGHRDSVPLIHYGVTARDNSQPNGGAFVSVEAGSVLHLRYRMKKPDHLILFCITQQPGGRFGGNFEIGFPPGAGTSSADGWRVLEVPLSDMRPLQSRLAQHPAGNGISHISVKTLKRDAVLEVAEMSIAPASP